MHKTRRTIIAGLSATMLAAGLLTASVAHSVTAPTSVPVTGSDEQVLSEALSDLRTCLSQDGAALDVYYLIDNSRSMRVIGREGRERPGTDVDGLRYKAVERSLIPLMELADTGIEVNVAGGLFSRGGETVADWLNIKPGSENAIEAFARDLGAIEAGGGTNWPAGVREAQEQLANQASQSTVRCQTLVWVTDGGIDIERNPDKTADGVVDLCGVGPKDFGAPPATQGLMYELRRAGVVVFGVQLRVPEAIREDLTEGTVREQDSKFSYFKPVVEGSGPVNASFFNDDVVVTGTLNCGQVVDNAQGAVILIEEASEFAQNFEELVACIANSCTILSDPVLCSNGICSVPVPQGIAAMEFFAPAGFDVLNVLTPQGARICLEEGCSPDALPAAGGLLRVPIRNVAGVWQVRTDADSIRPLLFSGIKIDVDPIEVDPRNPVISAGVGLRQSFGAQFDVNNYKQPLNFRADIRFPDGSSTSGSVNPDGSAWKLTWEPTDEFRGKIPNAVEITLQATALGLAPDVPELPLQSEERLVQVRQMKLDSFPTLVQPEPGQTAFFSTVEGLEGVGTTTLIFRGPELNDGKVCWLHDSGGFIGSVLDPANRPDGTLSADITAGTAEVAVCPDGTQGVALPRGTEVPVEISLRASEQADATVSGVMNFDLFGPEGESGFAQGVPFEAKTTVVKNEIARLLVLISLILLGIGVPYLALLFFARRQAAFSSQLDGNRYAALPVKVGPEGLLELTEVAPDKYEFLFLDQSGLTREVATGTETHRVVPPKFWPFKPVTTVVQTSPTNSIFTNYDHHITANRSEGLSSQVLSNVFYFLPDPPESGRSFTETQIDDWGNEISVSIDSAPESGAPVTGRLIVISSGDGNVAESIAKATARARMWPAWSEIYSAVMATPAVVPPAAKTQSQATAPEQPTSEDNWWVTDQSAQADESTDKPKRSRFGRNKKGKGSAEPDDFNNDTPFQSNDW